MDPPSADGDPSRAALVEGVPGLEVELGGVPAALFFAAPAAAGGFLPETAAQNGDAFAP